MTAACLKCLTACPMSDFILPVHICISQMCCCILDVCGCIVNACVCMATSFRYTPTYLECINAYLPFMVPYLTGTVWLLTSGVRLHATHAQPHTSRVCLYIMHRLPLYCGVRLCTTDVQLYILPTWLCAILVPLYTLDAYHACKATHPRSAPRTTIMHHCAPSQYTQVQ